MIKRDWIECTFEDLLDYEQPTNYIIKEEDYNDKYQTPVLTAGKGFIKGYTKEDFGIFDRLPTIIFDDFTTATQFVNFPFKVKSSAMKILIPKSDLVDLKFVYGLMQTINVRAETHKRYWISEYSKLKIFLPPLPIQRAIVKKTEQLFSALDAGIADLKKAQEQLKVYRQAVLNKAFEGEFTQDWRNDNKVHKKWLECTLLDACNKIQDGSHFSPQNQYFEKTDGRFAYITAKNIRHNHMDLSNITYVDRSFHETIYHRCNPEYGDVLLTKDGVNTGEVTLNTLKEPFSLLSSVCLFKTKREKLLPIYLKYYIQSPIGRSNIIGKMTGTAIKRIVLKTIKQSRINLPTVEEQDKIVKEIESRLSNCDALEQQINASLQQSEALRQSILRKAFAGELLTQAEVAACKKEPDYEPASVLLKRIKEEKGKVKTINKKIISSQEIKPAIVKAPKISADIHAGLIAKIIKLHETKPDYRNKLSHIKCEKIAHLVEYHAQVPLGRQPVKDAAGPDDYPHLKKVESRAIKAGFFKIKKNNIGYTYLPGKQIDNVIKKFETSLSTDQCNKVNALLQLFLHFDLEQAEIAATTYAGWNNLIILGNSNPSDEEIVTESRENWSARKLKIPRERFFNAINWLRKKEVNLIPTGYGLFVASPVKKKK